MCCLVERTTKYRKMFSQFTHTFVYIYIYIDDVCKKPQIERNAKQRHCCQEFPLKAQ